LEQCRAQALNRTTVRGFFQLLREVVEEYKIPMENIYNMDEKGIQLGIGSRIAAFIDRDQATVYNIEHGNRELVMVIEAVCADGSFLHPLVIYQAARRDLEWPRNNPCNASLSHSLKGWTDQELGFKWLQKDFEPQTAAQNRSGGYRLLILDGHNSHGTYQFCKFAANHRIIVLCLPSHTTHALQPLDVGIFRPLSSAWKKQVNEASRQFIGIKKNNLLVYYKNAHDKAMSPNTIKSAFTKAGIYPLNPDAIEESAYEPALNTTMQPVPPVSSLLPSFLTSVPTDTSTATSLPSTATSTQPQSAPWATAGDPLAQTSHIIQPHSVPR
ncbi:hypothetical protein HYDPIDRAFT_101866, partial [Hydnomerulius pinastri MD-312]